ncbi:hypothetical protein G7Y79_00031g066280 [Physcia stellaris]|nr:hypothetical protein G7Y79_00031g066280 [Physcia stellaris]
MGCCKSNPCLQNGCPQVNLTAGFLSSNPSEAAEFNPSGGSSAATSSPTATSRLSSSTTDSTSQPDVTNSPSKSSHTGAIAGGAIGGVAAIALLILLLFHYKKKSSKSRQNMIESRVAPEKPVPMYPESNTVAHDAKHSPFPEKQFSTPAPVYPTSPSLPSYPHSPSEMDSQPYLKPKQSLSQNFHQTYSTSGDYLPNALGLNAPSPNHNGRYTAYSTTNSPAVLSPLASPVVELDGTTSENAPSRHTKAAQ